MAIKEFISLEGVDEVKSQLADLQAAGEKASDSFTKIGEGLAVPSTGQIQVTLQEASRAIADSANASRGLGSGFESLGVSTRGLTEILHILRPALEEVGISLRGVRELAILARGGVDVLAAGISAAVAVGLAKLGEETERTQAQLTSLLGSTSRGNAAFSALE